MRFSLQITWTTVVVGIFIFLCSSRFLSQVAPIKLYIYLTSEIVLTTFNETLFYVINYDMINLD